MNDTDDKWKRKVEGGSVIGAVKKVIKYAKDIVILANDAEELQNMLKSLEKSVDKNVLEVNINKKKP